MTLQQLAKEVEHLEAELKAAIEDIGEDKIISVLRGM